MPQLPNKPYQLFLALILVALYSYIPNFVTSVYAADLTGNGYIIKMGTINIVGGTVSSPSVKLSTTVGQTTSGEFETTGYRIRSGFQYVRTNEPFSFILGNDSINLGTVIANTFAKTSTTLTVNGVGVRGYTIQAIEDHPLQIGESPSIIRDTVCDAAEKCTPNHASPWTSTSSYGFGHNLSTDDPTLFRPFANNQQNQNPVTLISSPKSTKKTTTTITFQASISPTQGSGLYENSIQFIALPSY